MRSLILFVAAAGATVAAVPASAQSYRAPPAYGYGYNGYGYDGYGYRGNDYGQVRALQFRINSLQNQIHYLDRRDVIRDGRADRLSREAERLERRLHRAARDGLNPYEANDIRARLADLEQRVHYAVANRYGDEDRDGGWGRDRD